MIPDPTGLPPERAARIAGPLARVLAEIARLRELPLGLADRSATTRSRRGPPGGRRPP